MSARGPTRQAEADTGGGERPRLSAAVLASGITMTRRLALPCKLPIRYTARHRRKTHERRGTRVGRAEALGGEGT
jgi:hypothetical protein